MGLKCQCFLASLRVQRALVNVFSFQKQRCVVAFQVGKEKKYIWGWETVLWCQRGASFNFFSSFFKLILQGYAAWGRSDLLPEIPPIPPHKRAYQPRRVFRYLNATPWFHWTPPAALPNCFATSQTRSTGMGSEQMMAYCWKYVDSNHLVLMGDWRQMTVFRSTNTMEYMTSFMRKNMEKLQKDNIWEKDL